ncbi:MAG: Gmad2 immunoglobulin-like domain-containing protein [Candidatus Paceibacterota bacterium]
MKKTSTVLFGILILIIVASVAFLYVAEKKDLQNTPENGEEIGSEVREHIESKSDLIVLDVPEVNAKVNSPLVIRGEARGMWYFEASFSVRLIDANGVVLAHHYATAKEDWMTEEFVPFESTITFTQPQTETGTLILEKQNASGLPEHADELRIPVSFTMGSEVAKRTVELYYYNPELDTDSSGNVMCSSDGLVAVTRDIPITQTPIQDTVRLLLEGKLTQSEEAEGITTEYPLDGVALEGASLENGVLTLSFTDPNNKTGGGSCRVGILWSQISETAKQFDEVSEVRFTPEELFQP